MVMTIEQLTNRIVFLESQILVLLSATKGVKHNAKGIKSDAKGVKSNAKGVKSDAKGIKSASAFNIFAKYFTPHIRSALFNTNFILTKDLHFKPTHQQIIVEISAMWNDLTLEEKSHWKLSH